MASNIMSVTSPFLHPVRNLVAWSSLTHHLLIYHHLSPYSTVAQQDAGPAKGALNNLIYMRMLPLLSTSTMSSFFHPAAFRSRTPFLAARASRHVLTRQPARYASSAGPPRRSTGRVIGLLAVGIVSAAAAFSYPYLTKQEPPKPQAPKIKFEKAEPQPRAGDEDALDQLSPQHLQVKKSWENPGVFAWGSNTGRVVAPDSNEAAIKAPRRLSYFDGQLLRDLKLDRNFGAAVTENGDLVQWGVAYSKNVTSPVPTLKGKDLVKISLSKDRIIALSSNGSVYSLPVSAADQAAGAREENKSWGSFWSSQPTINYRTLQPNSLGWGESVIDIKSGLEHCLFLTSKGRVFSAASSAEDFPSKGQLGIQDLNWNTRPEGPYDQLHEVVGLRGSKIVQIAAGDYHSLALDHKGHISSFGDNSAGQLGFELDPEAPYVDNPVALSTGGLYSSTGLSPLVTSIAAGGMNSYFTVDASKSGSQKSRGRDDTVVADTWASGEGIYGSLGTGKWTHISNGPVKIKALSNLSEFDEKSNKLVPIRASRISAGSTHACAVLDNATNTSSSRQQKAPAAGDAHWGSDVLWWGGNEHYQLGTGRRSNANTPTYIGLLEGRGDETRKRPGDDRNRFQIAPRTTTRLGDEAKGRKASVEQRVECGRYVTAVYSGT